MSYSDFLQSKEVRAQAHGKTFAPDDIHPMLFDFQRDVCLWALRKGRALVGMDTGLGKTFVQKVVDLFSYQELENG